VSNTILSNLVQQGYDPLLSLDQVAALTSIHKRTLRRLADQDKLKIVRISARRCGVRRSEYERFLASREGA
jgi:excisionase family DNA binding protein